MKTILVAEDDRGSRALLCELLAREGYRVVEAADGAEALRLLTAEPPDLLIADIKMPGLDGLELVRRLRALPEFAALPAIALTAHSDLDTREDALAAGFNHYLTKPLHWPALRQLIVDSLR